MYLSLCFFHSVEKDYKTQVKDDKKKSQKFKKNYCVTLKLQKGAFTTDSQKKGH